MKLTVIVLILCTLSGCSSQGQNLDRISQLRTQLIEAKQCTFAATVSAYYTEEIYQFQVNCSVDDTGTLSFTVTAPETIMGINGNISGDGAALAFDNEVLAFPIMADERISPVSAPWVFYNTLRCGYLSGYTESSEGNLLSMDDSFEENPLHLEIQTDENYVPLNVQIYYQQKMVLALEIHDFSLV